MMGMRNNGTAVVAGRWVLERTPTGQGNPVLSALNSSTHDTLKPGPLADDRQPTSALDATVGPLSGIRYPAMQV